MRIADIHSRPRGLSRALYCGKRLLRLASPFRSATSRREPANTFEGELLAYYADQPLIQPIGVVLTISTIAALVAYHTDLIWPAAWVLLIIGYHILYGYCILPRLLTPDIEKQKRNLKIYCGLAALGGVIYALSVGFFPFISQIEQFIIAVIIAALCTSGVTALAGYTPALNLHVGIPLVAIAVGLVLFPHPEMGSILPEWINDVFAFLILVYLTVILAHGRQVFRLFRDSFDIRLSQVALNKELRTALEAAESANRAKTRFLASASHDLRQPIHTLSLFSAALSMRELDAKSREIVDSMDSALSTLAVQLDTLLDISRLDAGIIVPQEKVCDLQSSVQGLRREFALLCADQGLELKQDTCGPAHARTDPALLARILRNLLSNAVRYTESGSITIGLRLTGGMHVLSVSDTGMGIPQAEQAHIFEEFYQLHNPERDRTKGLGLGLPIVRRLAQMLSIELDIVSAPGHGTTVNLRLPAVDAASDDDDEPHTIATPAAVAGTSVLVIDDEAGIRRGMKMFLEDLGYKVSLADSTATAVKQAQSKKPEIVLADLRLRGDDNGIRAIASIRALHPAIRAVLISGDTAPQRLREAHAAGVEFLHKPVEPEHLRHVLHMLSPAK